MAEDLQNKQWMVDATCRCGATFKQHINQLERLAQRGETPLCRKCYKDDEQEIREAARALESRRSQCRANVRSMPVTTRTKDHY